MTSEVEPEPRQKYRPSRWSHVALCKASARRGPAKIAARFETAVFGKTFALLGMVFAVSSALCLSCCGSDEEDTRETLRGSRTSPGGKYTVEDWDCCPGRPRNLIRLRVNGSDQKATTLVDYVVRKTGVNPIFVWDDETHLTIRTNFTQLPGGSLLPPGEILQGVESALGVTISYPLYSAAEFKEALRSGKATAEYVLAASDVAASVYEDRRNPGDAKPSRRFGEPSFGSCEIILEAAHAGPFEKIRLVLGANHDREINEQIKRRNLWLEKGHGPEKGQPEVSGIELPFSGFSIGKLANGDYRKTALTAAFFEGLPPGEQCCFSVSGEEQSFAMTQYVDDDGSMRREWPKRLAGDTLRFRYVFDFDDKSISYVMPLGSVTDQINRFVACVEDR